jgi:hypothetical protein
MADCKLPLQFALLCGQKARDGFAYGLACVVFVECETWRWIHLKAMPLAAGLAPQVDARHRCWRAANRELTNLRRTARRRREPPARPPEYFQNTL